ncbi:MAG TPA: cytidine deaminase, partial [Flavobacteriaceae bacterium]|nr:cytidine deaminase [Flavobacteriaceae bacterium]
MKKHKIEINLEVYDSVSELPKDIQKLMNKAQQAREDAYAPYS